MMVGKMTSSTAAITLMQIVEVVSICCLTVLFEVMPMTNIATFLPTHGNNGIDNTANILKTLTTATTTSIVKSKERDSISSANTANFFYQSQDSHEHNIGLIGIGISTVNYNSPPPSRRDSRSNFRNDDDFESDLNNNNNNRKPANNITTGDRGRGGGVGGSSKLLHSSFRIEEDVIKALTKVAEKRGLSLSSLVNKTLKDYVTSEMYFEELGFILVSKNFLRKTFEGLDQKHVEELGREYGLTMAKEYVSYFYPQVNSNTLVQFLEIWFKRFQSCQHRVDEADKNLHYFTVNHDINMNFSLALQSILAGLIEPIVKSTVEFTNITSSAITFSFRI
jgi:hypothetical protein